MKTTISLLCVGIAVIPVFCFAQASDAAAPDEPLSTLARTAVSEEPALAANAIERLRAAGPAGLDAMFEAHRDAIEAHQQRALLPPSTPDNSNWIRLHDALDAVGQQRDCFASHLYWFTDLDQAKAAARASGKPILSLRLLGKLNEEYSCANSRFFRTTLYANADVSRVLREQFVLHWQSVRPVPRITIDFGEGRKLERTITGNSIHYILDSEGRPVDALPGLYGSVAFLNGLQQARDAAIRVATLSGVERNAFMNQYHGAALRKIQAQWERDRAQLGMAVPPTAPVESTPIKNPDATTAGMRAFSKSGVESPLLRGMQPKASLQRSGELNSDAEWAAIGVLHSGNVRLDNASMDLIRAKQPTAEEASRLAISKRIVETPMMRMVRNLEHSIAEDTVRNEYLFHARIHEWFLNGDAAVPLDALNKKVYAELFLTPDSDPWLGLAPADVFSALDRGGLSRATVDR